MGGQDGDAVPGCMGECLRLEGQVAGCVQHFRVEDRVSTLTPTKARALPAPRLAVPLGGMGPVPGPLLPEWVGRLHSGLHAPRVRPCGSVLSLRFRLPQELPKYPGQLRALIDVLVPVAEV